MRFSHVLVFAALLAIPQLAHGQSWPSGWVPQATVHAQIEGHREQLYACYVTHVPAKSRKHGDVVSMRMVVSETGRVFRVDFLESSYTSKKFETCLRKIFAGLDFGIKPSEKMTFVQKFGFQNGLRNLKIERPKNAGGAITTESVKRAAQARQEEIQACYEEALKSSPNLRGQLLVELVIDGRTGNVQSVKKVKSTLGNPAVESCVISKVRTFSFGVPADPGIVIIQYPFTFDSS